MTGTRSRAWAIPRVLVTIAVLFAAVAVPLVSTATPAYAGPGGWWDDGGPGNGGGGSGDLSGDLGSGGCRNGQLIHGGQKAYDGPYHSCVGRPTVSGRGDFSNILCMTGFEVYRFYGTVANPTQAVVRGRLNTASYCGTEALYRFSTVNPYDSGYLGGMQAMSMSGGAGVQPWHAQRPANNPDATRIAAYEAPGRLWDLTPVWRWMPDSAHYWTGKLTDGVVTSQVRGNCANVQTSNGYRADLDNPATPEADKQLVRALLWKMYLKMGGGSYALTQLNMASFTRNGGLDTSPLVPNEEGTYPDTFSIAWDNMPCSSPFDYVSNVGPNDPNNTVTGVCYIPTMHSARQYLVRDGGEQRYWNDWSSISSTIERGGLRYSGFYAGSAGTANRELPGNSGLSQGTANAVGSVWRGAMAADYYSRIGGGPYWTDGGRQTQKAPAQPYTNESSRYFFGKAWDANAAAATLRDSSHCTFGDHASWTTINGGMKTPAPSVAQTIKVTVPDAFQVGGMLRVQNVRAEALPLTCNGGPCGPGDRVRMLHYRLDVQGTAGYKRCADGQSFGCDFAVITKPSVLTGDRDIQQTQQLTVIFYNPTMPTQAVRATLNDVGAKFAHDWEMTTPKATLTSEDGTPIELGGERVTGTEVKPYTPTVVGAPREVPVIGASAIPGR